MTNRVGNTMHGMYMQYKVGSKINVPEIIVEIVLECWGNKISKYIKFCDCVWQQLFYFHVKNIYYMCPTSPFELCSYILVWMLQRKREGWEDQ